MAATGVGLVCCSVGQFLFLGLGLVLGLANFYRGKRGRSPVSPLLGSAIACFFFSIPRGREHSLQAAAGSRWGR